MYNKYKKEIHIVAISVLVSILIMTGVLRLIMHSTDNEPTHTEVVKKKEQITQEIEHEANKNIDTTISVWDAISTLDW